MVFRSQRIVFSPTAVETGSLTIFVKKVSFFKELHRMKKQFPTGPITNLIRQISRLETFKQRKTATFETLTSRETEVLQLIAQGKNNPAISKELGITRATVQNHRAMIREKLEIKNEQGFMKYALAFDLIDF